MALEVQIELSGGLELLFGNQKRFPLTLTQAITLKQLIFLLKEEKLRGRPEHFLSGSSL